MKMLLKLHSEEDDPHDYAVVATLSEESTRRWAEEEELVRELPTAVLSVRFDSPYFDVFELQEPLDKGEVAELRDRLDDEEVVIVVDVPEDLLGDEMRLEYRHAVYWRCGGGTYLSTVFKHAGEERTSTRFFPLNTRSAFEG